MTASLVRTAAALLLGSTAMLSQAATVNLTDWAFPNGGNTVTVGSPGHTGPAGGFKGSVSFAGTENGFSVKLSDFVTYCVEIDQSFSLASGNMTDYSVVAGASYAQWIDAGNSNNTAAGTATRLGQLLSYVGSTPGAVTNAAQSTSLQLAIWNVIYDNDADLDIGLFKSTGSGSGFNSYAETLLTASNSAHYANKLDVFVLSNGKSQDFLLTRTASPIPNDPQQNPVPEPASLALSLLGLAAAGAVSRRRRA